MAANVKVLADLQLCLVGYSGKVSLEDFEAVRSELRATEAYRLDFDDLVLIAPDADISYVAHHEAQDEATRFATIQAGPSALQLKRVALVCADEVQMAIVRLYAALVRLRAPEKVEITTFHHIEPALEWIEPSKGEGRQLSLAKIADAIEELGQDWSYDEAKRSSNG